MIVGHCRITVGVCRLRSDSSDRSNTVTVPLSASSRTGSMQRRPPGIGSPAPVQSYLQKIRLRVPSHRSSKSPKVSGLRLCSVGAAASALPPEKRQQPSLWTHGRAVTSSLNMPLAQRGLRFDHLKAAFHQRVVERRILARRHRKVPPVHEHVQEAMTCVHRSRYGAVRHCAGSIHHPRPMEDRGGGPSRLVVRSGGIITEYVAVEPLADIGDGCTCSEFRSPEVS